MTDDFGTPRTAAPGEVPRDKPWNRPILPHPETGITQVWRRPSTICEPLVDTRGLEKWRQRTLAKTVASNATLRALFYATPAEDKSELNKLVWRALQRGGINDAADNGTARHRLFEVHDKDPAAWLPDPGEPGMTAEVLAWRDALAAEGIALDPNLVERMVICPELDAAGTFDRIGFGTRNQWQKPRVVDLKTGNYDNIMRYSQLEYSAQEGTYAAGTAMVPRWWPEGGTKDDYEPMPVVDREVGLLVVMPPGTLDAAKVRFIEVDLVAGLEAARFAVTIDAWRKRSDLLVAVPASLPTMLGPRTGLAGQPAAGLDVPVAALGLSDDTTHANDAPTVVDLTPARKLVAAHALALAIDAVDAAGGDVESVMPEPAAAPAAPKRGRGRPSKAQLEAERAEAMAALAEGRASDAERVIVIPVAEQGAQGVPVGGPVGPGLMQAAAEQGAREREESFVAITEARHLTANPPAASEPAQVYCAHGEGPLNACIPCAIDEATTPAELSALWQAHRDAWTPELTEYGKRHLAEVAGRS